MFKDKRYLHKRGIFLHSVGPEGLKAFNQMTRVGGGSNSNVFSQAINDFDSYFSPKVCIGILRYKFFQRKQNIDESVDYVSALRTLSLDCQFGNLQEDLIRDQVVMLVRDSSIQERLWVNGDSKLDDILAIVRKAEMSCRSTKEVKVEDNSKSSGTVTKISATSVKPDGYNKKKHATIKERNVVKDKQVLLM